MDSNPMRQGRYSTIVSQGEITGKGFPDYDILDERRANAADKQLMPRSYPGANDPLNLYIKAGELVYGLKENRVEEMMDGSMSERLVSSVNGLHHDMYNSVRSMTDEHYLAGVAKTDCEYDSDQDNQNGISFLRVGSISIVLNGPKTVYPGQPLQWRFPDPEKLRKDGIGAYNRGGTPGKKLTLEVVPFDPTDVDMHVAGVYNALRTAGIDPRGPGVKGLSIGDFFAREYASDAPKLTSLQQETLGYKYGWLGGILCGALDALNVAGYTLRGPGDAVVTPQQLATNVLGLFRNNDNDIVLQQAIFARIFCNSLPRGTSGDATKARDVLLNGESPATVQGYMKGTDQAKLYRAMRLNAAKMALSAQYLTWNSMGNTVFGVAASAANPGDTVDVLIGHNRRAP
jgi:hypothetical protein